MHPRGFTRPVRSRLRSAVAASIATVLAVGTLVAVSPAAAAEPDLARVGTITASAEQNDADGTFPAANAIDGNDATRWASGNGPDEDVPFTASLTSDLGSVATLTGVSILWEASYAVAYDVQVATADPDNPASWTTAKSITAGTGGAESVAFSAPVDARYVRLALLQRSAAVWDAPRQHWYGYSIFTFSVHGAFALPNVGFDAASSSVRAGSAASVAVSLTGPATDAQSVRVTSGGGNAVPGTDFTAVDEVLTFAPGETTKTVSVPTVSRGALAPSTSTVLTLSDPTAGIALGARATSRLTITPTGDLPNSGPSAVFQDFESGVPADYSVWASTDALRPALTTVPDDSVPTSAAGNDVLTATVTGSPTSGDWFGFTNDTASTNWSDSDGFSFWFLGTGSGKTLAYELKNGNQMFDRTVVDDSVGWRQVSVLFSELRLKGAPGNPARFLPSASTGFAVTLTGLGAGSWSFDDFALFDRVYLLEDFEGSVPVGTPPTGFFTWGSDPASVTLGVEDRDRGDVVGNRVLAGDYLIASGGYGGFSDNLAVSQDWSSFKGIRFWWYASQASNPASPTAGDDIKVEIKDGGPDAEHSELWSMTFKDNWGSSTSRWKLVELPFSSFTIGAYQPGNAQTQNGTLDLTSAWGFAPTFTPGKAARTGWAIDDVALYGTPSTAPITVTSAEDVYLVDAGETAKVTLTLNTPTGDPLGAALSVAYSAGTGTAQAGTHFTDFSGTVVFPAGSASGSTQSFDVQTLATPGGDESRSIPILLAATGAQVPTTAPRVVVNAHDLPYLDADLSTEARVDDLLERMSLAEKVGQMAQAERLGLRSVDQISSLGLGSLLSGGGSVPSQNTPEGWADMIDGYQRQALSTSLQVPLLYGADAVHGHNNVVDATIFPHNIGLGATRDPGLVQQISEATASETKATGVNWAFAPCLCVTRDDRWGRAYESFGEDPALVKMFAAPTTIGLQGADAGDMSGTSEVLATAKHWAGDGGTAYDPAKLAAGGYPIDQGLTTMPSLEAFVATHVDPYLPAIEAGVGSMMPSYSGVDVGAGDVRMHENTLLNTELLKGELGFDGFLISDWEGIDKLPGGTYAQKAVRSVNSGLDMAMAPYNYADFITSIETAVGTGAVAQSRVDDAVRRILTQKFALGLFENAITDRANAADVGSAEHRSVAREAVAESQVLLKNDDVLPLSKDASIYLAGSNTDDLGNQMGGWTISWQGRSGATTAGTTIAQGLQQVAPAANVTVSPDASAPLAGHDVGVVVVGETPYAEGVGDVGNNGHSLSLTDRDRTAIDTVCAAMECVVLVVAGRTQLVTDKLDAIDGLVASFLPGSEGAGVADVLFGDEPFSGRLPLSWPATAEQVPINVGDAAYEPLFPFGWSERTDTPRDRVTTVLESIPAGDARVAVAALLDADVWGTDGSIDDPEAALPLIATAARLLTGVNADLIVSLARDLAQGAVTAGTAVAGSLAITANAEVALLSGQQYAAVQLLASVLGVTLVDQPGGTPGGTPGGAPGGNPGATPGETPDKATVAARLSTDRARIGERVTVSASGFVAGEQVTATIYSDPIVLGTVTASTSGLATLTFRVPSAIDLGLHSVQLEGANQIAAAALTVVGAAGGSATVTAAASGSLAVTGAEIWLAVMIALALVATGVTAVVGSRRSRAERV
jgi:beta-glucosidase